MIDFNASLILTALSFKYKVLLWGHSDCVDRRSLKPSNDTQSAKWPRHYFINALIMNRPCNAS